MRAKIRPLYMVKHRNSPQLYIAYFIAKCEILGKRQWCDCAEKLKLDIYVISRLRFI